MSEQLVTVFGGAGFLGRRIVSHLGDADFAVRIASRYPPPSTNPASIETVHADINDDTSAAAAISGARAVVNAVSLYVEHGSRTFRSIHVEAAGRVATMARRAGVELGALSPGP